MSRRKARWTGQIRLQLVLKLRAEIEAGLYLTSSKIDIAAKRLGQELACDRLKLADAGV